jgi:hypothetical protein
MSNPLRDRAAFAMLRQQRAAENYDAFQRRIDEKEMIFGPGSVPSWSEGENVPGLNLWPGDMEMMMGQAQQGVVDDSFLAPTIELLRNRDIDT